MAAPIVLVAGASSGIGRARKYSFAQKACRVSGTSLHPEATAPIPGVESLALHLPNDMCAKHRTAGVLEWVGRVDVLFNDAGCGMVGAIEETRPDEVRWRARRSRSTVGSGAPASPHARRPRASQPPGDVRIELIGQG